MLKRKIERQLTEWKNTSGHKPLIVKGCRQCGKTFSVLDFAKKNYKHVVYLNFFENPDYASVFAGSLEIDNIVMMLSALLGKDAVFKAGETVLVLDEIQDCPEARTALKFFRIVRAAAVHGQRFCSRGRLQPGGIPGCAGLRHRRHHHHRLKPRQPAGR